MVFSLIKRLKTAWTRLEMTNAVYVKRFTVNAHCYFKGFPGLELGEGESRAQAHFAILRV
jgi:hypothetical protein